VKLFQSQKKKKISFERIQNKGEISHVLLIIKSLEKKRCLA